MNAILYDVAFPIKHVCTQLYEEFYAQRVKGNEICVYDNIFCNSLELKIMKRNEVLWPEPDGPLMFVYAGAGDGSVIKVLEFYYE